MLPVRQPLVAGKTGWLLPPKEVKGLSAAIIDALSNREQAHRFAAAGRELCKDRFRWETMVDAVEALYNRLLARRGGAAGSAK